MNKVTRNTCKFCRYMKCKDTGMVNKWVLSAYKINKGEKKDQSTKQSKEEKNGRLASPDSLEFSGIRQVSKTNNSKYDICETETLIKEMIRKDTLCSIVNKKVCKYE